MCAADAVRVLIHAEDERGCRACGRGPLGAEMHDRFLVARVRSQFFAAVLAYAGTARGQAPGVSHSARSGTPYRPAPKEMVALPS